jgi:hypothetical protein
MQRYKSFNHDSYVPDCGVILDSVDIVDRIGYRTVEQQVTEMIDAGERLVAYRRGAYDFEPDDKNRYSTEEQSFDRNPNFDPADVTRIAQALGEKRKERVVKMVKVEDEKSVEEKKLVVEEKKDGSA